ncbi:MAG: hypothetical protein OJF49_004318 [Ktedonobacterales bacterium]|jgi:hypothetical protein|nr:MAG: hypothetical protein OJF49_004318 [Ktedonobacterales bacterium]
MELITYQALLSNPENVARIQALRREIERLGGTVSIGPPSKVGMVLVLLKLPEGLLPQRLFPGIPFYPI